MIKKKDIPSGWELKLIRDVAFFQEGPGVRNHQYTNDGVKLLNVGNINEGRLDLSTTSRYISEEEAYGKYSHFLVDEGDLLICSSGIVVDNFHNKIAFAEKRHLPLCMNTSTIRFKSLDKKILDINYFKYFLSTWLFKIQIQKLITGSAQLNFGPSHLNQMHIPLPSLSEQKRIAAILDKADEIRKKRRQAIDELNTLIPAIFYDMFGDPEKNQKGWELVPIQDHVNVQGGYAFKSNDYVKTGIKLVKITNVHYEVLSWDDSDYLPQEYADGYADYLLKEGDLVISLTRPIIQSLETVKMASVRKEDTPCLLNQRVARFVFKDNCLDPFYFKYLLYSNYFKRKVLKYCSVSLQPNMSTKQIESTPIVRPPIELQKVFSKKAREIRLIIDKHKQSATEADNLFNSLVQQAFKGEL
jgi:type I restriction enzyme S subunit